MSELGRRPSSSSSAAAAAAGCDAAPTMVMIAGAGSGAGKSTVSLTILLGLIRSGAYAPGDLAYIKPATQCQTTQLVTKWCRTIGVACAGFAPVVYRPGFSYEVIEGTTSSRKLLDAVRDAVAELAVGRRLVVIDGVGYPSVGTCTGTSNAAIAAAVGAPVVFVAPPGVGHAIDSLALAQAFFEKNGVAVIGAIVNRVSTSPDARHTPENCRKYVRMYCDQHHPDLRLLGFLPELSTMANGADRTACRLVRGGGDDDDDAALVEDERRRLRYIEDELVDRVDIASLLDGLRSYRCAQARTASG